MKHLLFMAVLFTVFVHPNQARDQPDSASDETSRTVPVEWNFNKFRFGGYGEMLFQRMDYGPDRYKAPSGSPADSRSYLTIPRSVFAMDYKFSEDLVFGAEVEFEYGGTGAAMELEYSEGGEYEMEIEKAGEVVLEQFHITKRLANWLNIRAGHLIVPVGLTNAHHEPVFFFGARRPEGEVAMLPSTWHETGIALLGYFPALKYELMLVNGLDPNGFSTANWVGSGKQGVFEQVVATHPAVAARVEYSGVKGLRLGTSGYYGRTAKNSTKPQSLTGMKGTVAIASADAQYLAHGVVARANVVYGYLSDSKAISNINSLLFNKTGYPITEVAKNALTYAVEAGYNVFSFFGTKEKLYPFVRYEYYNTAEALERGARQQPRYKVDLTALGINYQLLPQLVVKADYSIRRIDAGNYNSEHTFSAGIAYTGWFIHK
jgi:hypothetical protein